MLFNVIKCQTSYGVIDRYIAWLFNLARKFGYIPIIYLNAQNKLRNCKENISDCWKEIFSDFYQNYITCTWKAKKSSHKSHVRSFSCFLSAAAMLNYEISHWRDLKSKWKNKILISISLSSNHNCLLWMGI